MHRQELYTVSLGVEGNGPNFPVHIGAYIALLENNLIPTVLIGGSSASVTGSLLMALLENPSLTNKNLKSEYCHLTKAQKAALILAASVCVFDSFGFFPKVTNFYKTLFNWVKNFLSHNYRDTLVGDANIEIIQVENMIGQIALAFEFFRYADFMSVICEPDYSKRNKLLKQLWLEHTNIIETNVYELLKAVDNFSSSELKNINLKKLYRFLQIINKDMAINPSQSFNQFKNMLKRLDIRLILYITKKLYNLSKSKSSIPGRKIFTKILNKKICLFNPQYVWSASQGFSKSGKFLAIPEGMVIHSTFRCGFQTRGSLKEKPGFDNLYQCYFPAHNLVNYFVEHRDNSLKGKVGFLGFIQDDKHSFVIPPERILILSQQLQTKTRGYTYALQASISESGYFRRYPLPVLPIDNSLNPHLPNNLFSFGGWLEKMPIAEIAHLPICKNTDYFITLSRKDNVPWFSRKAWHTVLGKQNKKFTKKVFNLMDNHVSYAKSLSGCKGTINITFDDEWNNPVLNGTENFFLRDLLTGLLPNYKAHMLIGYLETSHILHSQFSSFNPNLSSKLLTWGKPVPAELYVLGKYAPRKIHQIFWNFLYEIEQDV